MKRLAVYCGARLGVRRTYAEAACAFGCLVASRGVGVVYGGAAHGLMGALADGVVSAGANWWESYPEGYGDRSFPTRSCRRSTSSTRCTSERP
jgi:predicted Rossmann-fold nucleotide-binding protein